MNKRSVALLISAVMMTLTVAASYFLFAFVVRTADLWPFVLLAIPTAMLWILAWVSMDDETEERRP